jgi:sortase A
MILKNYITTTRRVRMKKIAAKILVTLLFLSGLSLLLYPFVANKWNNYRQEQLITTYDEAVAEQAEAGVIEYDVEKVQARNYNEELKPYVLPDSFANAARTEEADETYMSCLNLTGSGMMGYVQIPKINVKIPIFHTTEEEVLRTAAGHLEGSSLPVGGEGNHAVISAHRGLPSATLFTDLDRLVEGDCFLLYILDEVLCYRVDQITVVEPEDTGALAAVEGMDLVTLLTCTPYGVNSHRLLVRGVRVPYEEIEDEMVATSGYTGPSLHTNYRLWVIVGLAITGGFILALYLYDRKVRRIRELKAALIENVKQGPYAQAPQVEEDNNSKEEQER